MPENITFDDLERLLAKLGFTPCEATASQRVFEYPPLSTLVVLPSYKAQELIRPIHLVAVRRTLIDNGLITAAAFDGFLEKIQA
jgi:hypothetical protein